MRVVNTSLANCRFIVDEVNIPVAVMINGVEAYRLYDYVQVSGDTRGYICPDIKHEGTGRIVEIRQDDTDHFFGILMNTGEFGYVKASRIRFLHRN